MKHKKNRRGEEIADLEGTLDEFSESVNVLLKNPSLENARNAQWRNMEAWSLVYELYLMIGYSNEVTEKFLRNSYDCLAGLSLVKEEDEFTLTNYGSGNYIPLLAKNVEKRINFAEGSRKYGLLIYIREKTKELLGNIA